MTNASLTNSFERNAVNCVSYNSQLNMIVHSVSSFNKTLPNWLYICLCAHMCIYIFACVYMYMWRPKVDFGYLPWSISTVHISLNPELFALATVASQLAPGVPCVGLTLAGPTSGLSHFWLAFYIARSWVHNSWCSHLCGLSWVPFLTCLKVHMAHAQLYSCLHWPHQNCMGIDRHIKEGFLSLGFCF